MRIALPTIVSSLVGVIRRVLGDRRGVSALEFAFIAPILIALPVPVFDLGLGLYAQMQVYSAAQSGAQYVLLHTYDSAQIQSAATSATPLAVTVASQQNCGCPNGTSITLGGAPGTCGTCAGGAAAGTYVQVTVSTTYTPLIAFPPLIRSSYALASTSTLRFQ